ncbi:MAG: hypothetical protein WBA46_16265 [Thermomicrobiales bacterium]
MLPLSHTMIMEIAASTVKDRRNEWPDDPDRVLVRLSELPQDPIYMSMRTARNRVTRWLGAVLGRSHADVEPTPASPARVISLTDGSANEPADREQAA